MLFCHPNRVRIAKKVRRVQHNNMQRVALDPFSAVEKPAQCPQGRRKRDAEGILHGVDRAHLIGNRADTANPRSNIGGFRKIAATQQRFEQTRRLEDLQLRACNLAVPHMNIERSLPFDPGKNIDTDGSTRHVPRFPCGRDRRQH